MVITSLTVGRFALSTIRLRAAAMYTFAISRNAGNNDTSDQNDQNAVC